jgi:hypothetical protein
VLFRTCAIRLAPVRVARRGDDTSKGWPCLAGGRVLCLLATRGCEQHGWASSSLDAAARKEDGEVCGWDESFLE